MKGVLKTAPGTLLLDSDSDTQLFQVNSWNLEHGTPVRVIPRTPSSPWNNEFKVKILSVFSLLPSHPFFSFPHFSSWYPNPLSHPRVKLLLSPSLPVLHIQVTRLLPESAPHLHPMVLSVPLPRPDLNPWAPSWRDPLLKEESDHRGLLLIKSWVTYQGPTAGKCVLLSSAKSGEIHQAAIQDECICPNRRQRLSVLSLDPLEDQRPS